LVAAIKASKKLLLKTKSVDYRTSGDITKDYDRVVGYYSAIIY
jgi:AmmeMemoRadiSam system protein B